MRIAVVTGASAGIGREFVYEIDRLGGLDEIWVIARRLERLEELKTKCKTPIRPIALDLSDMKALDEYRAILEKEKPEIGILVNSAGFGVFGPFAEGNLDRILSSVAVNSLALTGMCHISIPYMKEGDSIINVGSNSAWQPVSDCVRGQQKLCAELLESVVPGAPQQGYTRDVRVSRVDQNRVPAGGRA